MSREESTARFTFLAVFWLGVVFLAVGAWMAGDAHAWPVDETTDPAEIAKKLTGLWESPRRSPSFLRDSIWMACPTRSDRPNADQQEQSPEPR
jgi:hypothetical protein